MWHQFMRHFPRLKHLGVGPAPDEPIVHSAGAEVFSCLLEALTDQDLDQRHGPSLASELETIKWEEMLLDQATVDALVRLLEVRARRGIPLSKLSFKNAVCLKELDIHLAKSELARHLEVEIV